MDTNSADSRENLKKRFQETLKKVAEDSKLAEIVKNRNFLEKIFANNIRDLADIGIRQNEIISELSQEIREAIKLINQGLLHTEQLIQYIDILRNAQEKSVTEFVEKFKGVFRILLQEDARIKSLKSRMDSDKSTEKCILAIKELASKNNRTPEEIFDNIKEVVEKYFRDFDTVLRNDDKRKILLTVKESNFPNFQSGVTIENKVGHLLDSIADETKRYIEYRNQLIALIDEFVKTNNKTDIDGKYTSDLLKTRKALQESQFEIVLVGEFQGGKSTTFNMLCGGREISPRGLNGGGIKTSAAIITVQNIVGNETKDGLAEWAEIKWLSEEKIKYRIKNVLSDYSNDEISDEKIPSILDYAWSQSPSVDDLDRLRIATLQYRLISKGVYQKAIQTTILPVDKFQHLVQFPADWDTGWREKQNAKFDDRDILFTCLDRVLVHIHSQYLEQLGCRVTDCPGLFVSQWDTERAMEVMKTANAIWYLLGGEKQIGNDVKKALTLIQDNKWEDKCFFTINIRKNKKATEKILESDKEILKNYNFCIENVYQYNALLSFRALQLRLFTKDDFSKHDIEFLLEETEGRELEELQNSIESRIDVVKEFIIQQLVSLSLKDAQKAINNSDNVLEDIINNILIVSNIKEILGAIEKFVIINKAYSILIGQGSSKLKKVLNAYIAELKRREKYATDNFEDAKQKFESANKKFENFKKKVENKFKFLQDDSLDLYMSKAFIDQYGEEIKNNMRERAKQICKEEWHNEEVNNSVTCFSDPPSPIIIRKINFFLPRNWSSNDVIRAVERRIQEEFNALFISKLNLFCKWEELKNNTVFNTKLLLPTKAGYEDVIQEWQQLRGYNDLFDGITFKTEAPNFLIYDSFSEFMVKIDVPWYSWEFFKDKCTLGLCRIFQTPDDRIDAFFDKEDPVGKAFDQFISDNAVRKILNNYLGMPRRFLADIIKCILKETESQLELNNQTNEKYMKIAGDKRKQLANEVQKKRETIVEPFMKRIERFESEVDNFYK